MAQRANQDKGTGEIRTLRQLEELLTLIAKSRTFKWA
jgi:hypothetical protein